MQEIYVFYDEKGIIKSTGYINRVYDSMCFNDDGSTLTEFITRQLVEKPNLSVLYTEDRMIPNATTHKVMNGELVPLTDADYAAIEAEKQRRRDNEIEQANLCVTEKLKGANDSVDLVTTVKTAKAAMKDILLAMQEIQKKIIPYILN